MHETSGTGERSLSVSVIVPCYGGAGRIEQCLRTLAEQTMPAEAYEVVVVLNGPDDGASTVLAEVRARHPRLRARIVRSPRPGASRARNLGLASAAGRYVTFVDHDDHVSPTFLETLLASSSAGLVGIATLADVKDQGGAPNFHNYIGDRLLRHAGTVMSPARVPSSLAFVAAKLVPTALARTIRFDEQLRSGEDLVFWYDLYDRYEFHLEICPLDAHAVYYRSLRSDSVSRQPPSYDFSITQRLDVIAHLVARSARHARSERVRNSLVLAQTTMMNGYLRKAPDDHARVIADIRARGLDDAIPFPRLNDGVARDLAVLYSFVPSADTSALVAARRIRARGTVLDVVSNVLKKGVDHSGEVIAHEFLARRFEAQTPASPYDWASLVEFCEQALHQITEWETNHHPYRSVYSRSMWPGSHLVAALLKVRRPDLRWIAEFSDPQLWNSHGERRRGSADPDTLWSELADGLRSAGVEPPTDRNVPHLVELLPYALADEILFTNDNQLEFMLGYLAETDLTARVRSRAIISPHPTLPREFYERVDTQYELSPGALNIAYFGTFYPTRGLTEVVSALEALTPDERAQVRMHVFTDKPAKLARELRDHDLSDVVIANGYVSYLEFLALTTKMDVLLVNDARTSQFYDRNPYLPSKWSDYAGSGSSTWAIVEHGSVLSGLASTYQSALGDVDGALGELRRMLADRRRLRGTRTDPLVTLCECAE